MNALGKCLVALLVGALWLALAGLSEGRKIRVRAAICVNKQCTDRAQAAFEPARIDVEAFVPSHRLNRLVRLGLACDGERPAWSEEDLDGQTDRPIYVRVYRNVSAGDCVGLAQVLRADGTHEAAQSVPLRVLSRF